jgi:hypothetical protein
MRLIIFRGTKETESNPMVIEYSVKFRNIPAFTFTEVTMELLLKFEDLNSALAAGDNHATMPRYVSRP